MKNIVLKTALITLGALAAAGILFFSLWILISPQSMATVSEKLGNYSFAVTCADLKYKYSGDTDDLARCAEDSILSKKDKLIIKYCEPLIDKKDFGDICLRKDEELSRVDYVGSSAADYRTYILGNLAVAQYRSGNLDKAIETAKRGDEKCFTKLVIAIVQKNSEEEIEKVTSSLNGYDGDYVKGLIALLTQNKS